MDNPISNAKIEALRRREAALKSAIAAEQLKCQKRFERERRRLIEILGKAMLGQAERSPDFGLMLQQVLKSADLDEKSRQFLMTMGF